MARRTCRHCARSAKGKPFRRLPDERVCARTGCPGAHDRARRMAVRLARPGRRRGRLGSFWRMPQLGTERGAARRTEVSVDPPRLAPERARGRGTATELRPVAPRRRSDALPPGFRPLPLALAYADWATPFVGRARKAAAIRREGGAKGRPLRHSMRFGKFRARLRAVHRALAAGPALHRARPGSNGRSTSSTRVFSSISSGGTTPRPESAACRAITSRWYRSRRASCSTSSRPSTSLRRTPRFLRPRSREGGQNLVRGADEFLADWERTVAGRPPVGSEAFEPGDSGRRHAGRGRLPQPPDRAHPVRAGDARGPCRAGADRAGLDHEILHPRPVAGEFAGEVPRRSRPHRVHDLLAQPGRRGPRSRASTTICGSA